MKVAVIYPEVYDLAKFGNKRKEFPPFGVMYLAAAIERVGIDVRLIKITPEAYNLNLTEYDAVALSIPSSVTYPLVKACRFLSSFNDKVLLMAGGVHANIYPQDTLLDLQVDVVAIGEGEVTIVELLEEITSRNFDKIKGICFKIGSQPLLTSPRPLITNLDALPFPARHLMDEEDFIMDDRLSTTDLKMTHIMFSRGCPFSCYFCARPQKKLQLRSGVSIRSELEYLKSNYSIEGFSVVDDNNLINKTNILDISRSIIDLNLQWNALARVDSIDREILMAMRDAGCFEITYGVESGSTRILKAMNKKITLEQIRNAIHQAFSLGIKVKIFIVHGFPGENNETTEETMNFLNEVGGMLHRVSLFRFVPLPGSYVFSHADTYGLHTEKGSFTLHDWSKYHIHHNHHHWWGTEKDFRVLSEAYQKLDAFVEQRWASRFS